MTDTNGQTFSSFTDLGEVYAAMTSAEGFTEGFSETLSQARLSIMDEPTDAPMPDPEAARLCVEEVIANLFRLTDDTRLAEFAQQLAWGFVNSFHVVAKRIERREDDAAQELGHLARHYDPSEVYQTELEDKQQLCQSLAEARAAIECMRDHAGAVYLVETGKPFNTIRGSRTSKALTASQVEAVDFLKARANDRKEAHNPTGPLVVFSGGHQWEDHRLIWDRLDSIRARIPSMTLCTTAQHKGADAIAAAWAANNGVATVAFRLNRNMGNSAAFHRNKVLCNLNPVEAIICEGSGVQVNLAQKLREQETPLHIIRQPKASRQAIQTKAA